MFKGRATVVSKRAELEELGDRAVNFYPDQLPDIKPRLRKLNLAWAQEAAADLVKAPPSAVLLGGIALSLARRRFGVATLFAVGLLLQQALGTGLKRGAVRKGRGAKETEREDLEIERYALKLQRGDYGKLEVIPFR